MATKEKATTKGLRGTEAGAKTRVLLALWDMGGANSQVKKGDLTERIKRTNERAADYQGVFGQLEEAGAIAISKNLVSLSDKGVQALGEGLKSAEFEFDGTQIGTRTANALLKWLREMGTLDGGVAASAGKGKAAGGAIASYDEFKPVALEVYDSLNRDELVPIYQMRREIGDRVTRDKFNEWLLKMQENDIFQLMAGEMSGITPDKRDDSITIPGGGLRYYAKRLNS